MTFFGSKLPSNEDLAKPIGTHKAKIFAGPDSLQDREQWREQLYQWRKTEKVRMNYDDSIYSNTKSSATFDYSMAQVWLWDELLFDFNTQSFTPQKLLDDYEKFGGLDSIVLIHAYPTLGLDSRNQFEYYYAVKGLKSLIEHFHDRGVKVYLSYSPWDRWTKRPQTTDAKQLTALINTFKFDGVLQDSYRTNRLQDVDGTIQSNPDAFLGCQINIDQDRISKEQISGGQWAADSKIPGVIRAKWFEPRHMVHQTRIWCRSHKEELHIAWLNGAGMYLWEVVYGSWMGWNPKETQMWKEMVTVFRSNEQLLKDCNWEPLTQLSLEAEQHGLYGSKFSNADSSLVTIVNKGLTDFRGEILPGVYGQIPGAGIGAVVITESGSSVIPFTYPQYSSEPIEKQITRLIPLRGIESKFEINYRDRECGLYGEINLLETWHPMASTRHRILRRSFIGKARLGVLGRYEVTNAQFYEFMQSSNYKPAIVNRFLMHWENNAPKYEDLDFPVTYVDLEDARAYAAWKGLEIPTEWEWQTFAHDRRRNSRSIWNLTDSVHSDGRTKFLILKGGSNFNIREQQGNLAPSGVAESDWYFEGGMQNPEWVQKLLLMGHGINRSENIGFTCFEVTKISQVQQEFLGG